MGHRSQHTASTLCELTDKPYSSAPTPSLTSPHPLQRRLLVEPRGVPGARRRAANGPQGGETEGVTVDVTTRPRPAGTRTHAFAVSLALSARALVRPAATLRLELGPVNWGATGKYWGRDSGALPRAPAFNFRLCLHLRLKRINRA